MVPRERAIWVTEELAPRPRDIYDVTKVTAEQLCQDVAAETGLPVWCLRTARFWDEPMHLELPGSIDRVYVNARAETELGYAPRRNFEHILRRWQEPVEPAAGRHEVTK